MTQTLRPLERVARLPPRLVLTGSNLISQGMMFVGGMIVARALGASGRGDLAIVAVYDDSSSRLLGAGMGVAVGESAARAGIHERHRVEAELLGASVRFAFMMLPASLGVAVLVYGFALGDASGPIRAMVLAAIVGTPLFNTVPNVGRMILIARGQTRRVAALLIIQGVSRLSLFAGLALTSQLTPIVAGAAFLGANWFTNALTMGAVGVWPRSGRPLGPLLRYGIVTVPGALATLTNSRLDQLLMVPLLSRADIGLYAVAVGVAFVPMNVGSTLGMSIFREAANDDSPGRMATASRLRQGAKFVALSGAASAVLAALLIVPVYGAEFRAAIVPAVVLLVGSSFTGMASMLGQVGNALRHPGFSSVSSMCALGVTIVGLPIFLPLLGILGAAIVSSVAYTVNCLVLFYLSKRASLF